MPEIDQLDIAIQGMVRTLNGPALQTAANAAGAEILREVESRAPVKSGQLKASIRTLIYAKDKAAKSIIQVANSKRGGIRHYAVFLEYGTARMAARPFMRPAFDASQQKAVEAFSKALSDELGKL